ncbi:hypothetical protein PXK00_10255 [Phaeobacter sp. QD34_3]|uniref:hypothetical protein n=1 Tax=unclassified Phaeobacter TaxID=2621772 RepID=UPI00237F73A2|nr:MULTISPECIES: hypothetical protein [unclassified Phaeobacter]MDE4133496.1 hypothetical protein [Phaeobacter sp. QD34_3]MDE4137132.1 hypothetical protein [Phaeobacter sp. QD34_24]
MRDLGTAAFLACAWFWCIGGFFPVLLYLEFGAVSFWVFLVFNVLGATLFGFAWREEARQAFLQRFHGWARGFSALVAGYHVVFAIWLSLMLEDPRPLAGFVLMTALCLVLRGRLITLSGGVLALSAALFVFIGLDPVLPPVPEPVATAPLRPFVHQIAPLALGFLLAPYFDLTFHRAFARAASPKRAFLIGFMLLFTALLCGVYLGMDAFVGLLSAGGLSHPAVAAVALLVMVQTGFTTAAHLVELDMVTWRLSHRQILGLGAVAAIAALHLGALAISPEALRLIGELIYRGFVFVIGALFPVLLILGPTRQAALAASVLAPCYTLGFLIGGAFAPWLSVAMLAFAAFYARRPAPSRSTPLAKEIP